MAGAYNAAMPRIYLATTELAEATLASLTATLPPARAARAARLCRKEARVQSVLGFCLVRYALYAVTGRVFDTDWQITDSGKPYLTGAPHFNLSHAAHAVAVAVSPDGAVGIDIEEVCEHHPRLAERICSEAELMALCEADDRTLALTQLWSAKEAEAKRLGTGLKNPKSIATKDVQSTCLTLGGIQHVLSLSPATDPLQIKWVTPEQLLL